MSDLIQWPRAQYWDKAWNPIIGCKPCSPACENCYAKAMSERFHKSFAPHASSHERPPRSGVVFCGNMTDLFGEWISNQDSATFITSSVIHATFTDATYIWLTKRVSWMTLSLDIIDENITAGHWLENHYFGFTAENQEWYDKRVKEFRGGMPEWANGWLSAEPLLGPIDLGLRYIAPEDMPFEWVVVGCESGPNRRPCKIEWVESIVEQCRAAKVPVFVKQLDIGGKCVTDITKFPKYLQIRQVPWKV